LPATIARSSTSASSRFCSSGPASGRRRGARGHGGGHVAHDGEHRALGRLANRGVRALRRARHGRADQHRVDELAWTGDELLGRAADELGQDDPAVAARAEQRGARHGVDDLLATDLVDVALVDREAVELLQARLQRQRHVVARVAVGDREDVQVVDLVAARLEMGERALERRAKANEAGVEHAGIGHGSEPCAGEPRRPSSPCRP
jgi:hypothetical protein